MEDNVLYHLSLKREYYTTELIIKWINEVGDIISPDHMQISTFGSNFMKYDGKILREEIENEAGKVGIDLHLCTEKEYFFTYVKEKDVRVIFSLKLLKENQRIERMLEELMCNGYGICATKCSSMDDFLQNLESIDLYSHYKGSIKGKRTTHHPDRPRKKIIDIECNPGHHHLKAGIWFGAYHCMWFGKDFYQYIPKEKLKVFSDCYENIELENEVLRITLYEDMWDYENPLNRNRQWDFRRSVGIDEVAHSLHSR